MKTTAATGTNQKPNTSIIPPVIDRTLRLRHRRVVLLIVGIVLLSIADLILTLHHLMTTGMMEANPLAAWIIKTTGSPWVLGIFKLTTVAASCALLFFVRHHRIGEAAAWTCASILVVMCFMWSAYTEELNDHATVHLVQTGPGSEAWLRFE